MAKSGSAQPVDNNGCKMHKEYSFSCGVCNGEFDNEGNKITRYDLYNSKDRAKRKSKAQPATEDYPKQKIIGNDNNIYELDVK